MKKKLLSLVLAGAMVASTSVSAFAEANVTTPDNKDGSANVKITGVVENNSGERPAGTFQVTVPTTASFTVDQNGRFMAADQMTIKNEGPQTIAVYADKFVDSTKTVGEGITAVKESLLEGNNRTYVTLNVYGSDGGVYLKTEDTSVSSNTGLYTDNTLATKAENEALKLTTVQPGGSEHLTLAGKAGKLTSSQDGGSVATAVSNDFTLTLKIKKVN